ncbi:MAG: TATA-box-binding protein [Candidatus Aenigmatarchaeota archaeon]|nr:MAG: TATA-box-binding protein [Candidatus Aenigmarchaeota archaeon]
MNEGKPKSEFDVKIENVVVFTTLGKDIPLDKISKELVDAEYKPESFPGVVYRVKDPKTAALIFSSGKIVCTGARSPDFARTAVDKVVDDMRALNIDLPTEYHTGVENIVASTQIEAKEKLNLEHIAYNLENAEYEPEQFPGLVYRISDPRVAFLLFGTGKIICTGARKEEEIHTALAKFKKNLEELGIPVNAVKLESKKK